eukprot:evm.model.NODE_390_length_22818_cov_35.022045.3
MSAPATTNGKISAAPPGARWNKGRSWDGIGKWCDDATAEEICLAVDKLSAENKRLTVVKAIKFLLSSYADKRALTYLDGKGQEIEVQTFSDVMDCADRIAAYLQREMGLRPGDRAVLLYPPGQEFILAFLGCIVAGVVAVPVYPPHPYRMETDLPRLNMIVNNSGCKVALTDSQYMLVIRGIAVKNMLSRVGLAKGATWPNLRNVQTDKIRKSYAHTELIVEPDPDPDDLAFLQYTSGSTSFPKGVMVTHANLIAQVRLLSLRSVGIFGYTNQLNVVSWLPQYHDMGLIGIFLECLSTGTHLIYMTPISFLQDPTMWLYTLHRYRAAVTCAPNFAFALAQRKTSEALRDSMDLSCIQCVICGAEPIRVEGTVDQIRRLIAEEFQVAVSVVMLVEPRSIPKTTSGKIQRHKCKLGYRDGSLKTEFLWEAAGSANGLALPPPTKVDVLALSLNSQNGEDDAMSDDSFVSATFGGAEFEDDFSSPETNYQRSPMKRRTSSLLGSGSGIAPVKLPAVGEVPAATGSPAGEEDRRDQEQEQILGADHWDVPSPVAVQSRKEALKKLVGSYMDLLVGSGREGSGKVLSYDRAVETCLEASTRRTHHHGFRVGATGRSAEELKASLKELMEEGETKPVNKTAQPPEVVFLFTGQGAGYKGMGRQLYERNAIFRASMDEVDALLTPHLGFSVLKTVVLAKDDYAVGDTTTLQSQPTLFAIEYSLTRVWAMLGVEPNVVMGHSVGEIVASVLAGVLSVADAAKLICVRAKAMHAVPAGRGGMSVVFVGEAGAQALCESYKLEIAAVNGDNCVTIAGSFGGLDAMQEHLKDKDIRFKRLDVARAFHTSHMESALPSMLEIVKEINVKAPKSTPKLVSLLSGGLMTEAPGLEHWADHVRKPVLFLQGMRSLLKDGRPRVFIELGPDAALTAMAKRIVPARDPNVALIPSMTKARREDENLRLAEAFGKAYVAGVNLKFKALKLLDTETSSYGRNDPPEQLAFRRGQWLTQKLREAELQDDIDPAVQKKIEEATRANVFPPPGVDVVIRKTLTPDAWYLVTGGLGGLGLHAANSLARPLDLWITYSSSSALMGSPGQSNYSAANTALDCIAVLRRQAGLSLGSLVLSTLLNRSAMAMPKTVCCHPVKWSVFVQRGPEYMVSGDLECFEPVKHRIPPKQEPLPLTDDVKAYGALETPWERTEMLEMAMISSLKKATGKDITKTQNLGDSGIASLEAVELIETLVRRFPVNIALGKLLEYPTVELLAKYVGSQLDRMVDSKRSLPLSLGQEVLLAQGLSRSYIYQEITFHGPLAPHALVEAWRQLLARHPVLRTILDLKPAEGIGRQQVLPLEDTPYKDMYGSVSSASKAKDTRSLEVVLGNAADTMNNVPGARLLSVKLATMTSTNPTDSTVLLAVPRMFLDRWSLRLLSSELTGLYMMSQAVASAAPGAAGPTLSPPLMSYQDAMRQAATQEIKGSPSISGGARSLRSGASSVGSEKARTLVPMSITGLTESNKPKDDSQSEEPLYGKEVGAIGDKNVQSLQLSVVARLAANKKNTEYVVNLASGPGHSMKDLGGFMHRFAFNTREVLLPTASRKKKDTPFQAPVSKAGAARDAGMLAAKNGLPVTIDSGSAAPAAGEEKQLGRDSLLDRLSVAVEGQQLAENSVYESSPSRFRRPRDDIDTAAHQGDTPGIVTLDVLSFVLQAFLAPVLATIAAAIAYQPTAALAVTLKLFPFFNWSTWNEGPVIFALFSTVGVVPMIAFPTLFASMASLTAQAALLPDAVLLFTARQAGLDNITADAIRGLFNTQEGVDTIKPALPAGMTLEGTPGTDSLVFVTTGAQAVKEVMLDAFGIPAATIYATRIGSEGIRHICVRLGFR